MSNNSYLEGDGKMYNLIFFLSKFQAFQYFPSLCADPEMEQGITESQN